MSDVAISVRMKRRLPALERVSPDSVRRFPSSSSIWGLSQPWLQAKVQLLFLVQIPRDARSLVSLVSYPGARVLE